MKDAFPTRLNSSFAIAALNAFHRGGPKGSALTRQGFVKCVAGLLREASRLGYDASGIVADAIGTSAEGEFLAARAGKATEKQGVTQ